MSSENTGPATIFDAFGITLEEAVERHPMDQYEHLVPDEVPWSIFNGDALEVLKTLPDNSHDACYCDPPYGIDFMGKEWDKGVPSAEVWQEVLRVLKPGAPILAFGGTRMWHRLAVNIEDAGFEIRDTFMWCYGQGFPKGLDLSKGIAKAGGDPSEVDKWKGYKTALKPAFEPLVYAVKPNSVERLIQTHYKMLEEVTCLLKLSANNAANLSELHPTELHEELGFVPSPVEKSPGGLSKGLSGKTDTSNSPEMASTCWNTVILWKNTLDALYAQKSRFTTKMEFEVITVLKTLKSLILPIMPHITTQGKTKELGKRSHVPGAVKVSKREQARLGKLQNTTVPENATEVPSLTQSDVQPAVRSFAQITASVNSALQSVIVAIESLSPEVEPIVVAQKPLDGTYVNNALEHGVAGYNIDGSRIGSGRYPTNFVMSHTEECVCKGTKKVKSQNPSYVPEEDTTKGEGGYAGGWKERPQGVGLGYGDAEGNEEVEDWECSDDCPVKILEDQTGTLVSGDGAIKKSSSSGREGNQGFSLGRESRPEGTVMTSYADSGGASRFYYCAKASTSEREAGLVPETGQKRANRHPTAKPVDLNRYFTNLILPPKRENEPRKLLIPFSGVGSEMIGAFKGGWDHVTGIELQAEYAELAHHRLRWWVFGGGADE